MKINSIINRYILTEMIPPFLITLALLTFVFLMSQILEITKLIVNYRVGMGDVLLLLTYSMPEFLGFTLPMSVMMAVLLTFLRMSGDNEIIAIKAGGVTIYRLLPPVLLFALIGCLLAGIMTVYGSSWGKLSFKRKAFEIAASNLDIGLKERTFNDSFKGVMLYVNHIDMQQKVLKDIFIEDQRSSGQSVTVIAPEGRLFSEKGQASFTLRLYDGSINQVDIGGRSVNSVNFSTYDIHLDLIRDVDADKNKEKDEDEMNLKELRHVIRTVDSRSKASVSAKIDFHRRFSIPFACLPLAVLAVALGLQSSSAKRSTGPGLGIVFFLLYYVVMTVGTSLSKTGTFPVPIGIWSANLVFGVFGLFLLVRTSKERYIRIEMWVYPVKMLMSRLFRKMHGDH